jgi:hypothetical protein
MAADHLVLDEADDGREDRAGDPAAHGLTDQSAEVRASRADSDRMPVRTATAPKPDKRFTQSAHRREAETPEEPNARVAVQSLFPPFKGFIEGISEDTSRGSSC